MPCRDDNFELELASNRAKESAEKIAFLEACLCALSKAVGDNYICFALKYRWNKNEKEIGVPFSKYNDWWIEHQKKDKTRLINEALAKLTDAEKKALGLNYK